MSLQAGEMAAPSRRSLGLMDLLRGLGWVFLTALLVAIGCALLRLAGVGVPPWALAIAMAAGLGLASGFSARPALRGRTLLLQGAAASAAVLVGLIVLSRLSLGVVGVEPGKPLALSAVGEAVAQVAFGIAGAWLAVGAWRPKSRVGTSDVQMPPFTVQVVRPTTPLAHSDRRPFRSPAGSIGRPRLRAQARLWERLPSLRGVRRPTWPSGLWLRRRARVRLVGSQEHRCPYCLEIVERHDPRGVVVCPICHTRHHADCWAVTGMCQVPHGLH
jgi:hypothetical protein